MWALHRMSPRISLAIMGRIYKTSPFYRARTD
jgi:hypothetical protein